MQNIDEFVELIYTIHYLSFNVEADTVVKLFIGKHVKMVNPESANTAEVLAEFIMFPLVNIIKDVSLSDKERALRITAAKAEILKAISALITKLVDMEVDTDNVLFRQLKFIEEFNSKETAIYICLTIVRSYLLSDRMNPGAVKDMLARDILNKAYVTGEPVSNVINIRKTVQ